MAGLEGWRLASGSFFNSMDPKLVQSMRQMDHEKT